MFKQTALAPIASLLATLSTLASCRSATLTHTTDVTRAAPPGACQILDLVPRNPHNNRPDLLGLGLGWDSRELFFAVSLRGAARGAEALTLRADEEGIKARAINGSESTDLRGVTLVGLRPDGGTVDLALCAPGGVQSRMDTGYILQVYNPRESIWVNACRPNSTTEDPRAFALPGEWDTGTGAHHASAERFTVTCQTGIIGKCVTWGYDPRSLRRGAVSMKDVHQACTRLARADYCGNGNPHTSGGVLIDVEDSMGIMIFDTSMSLALEATWDPSGARCLSYVRDGTTMAELQKECPERFASGALQVRESCEGEAERGVGATRGRQERVNWILRNRSEKH